METAKNGALSEERSIDWPLIIFFILAYAIAWGALVLVGLIAAFLVWRKGNQEANTKVSLG